MDDVYLIHYGIKRRSGRYPFGSGKRPFQSGGGPVGKAVRYVRKKKIDKQRKVNLEKARAKAAENRKLEADKERVLRSGSASEVLRYKGKLTNKELGDAVQRLNLESRLSELSASEKRSLMKDMDKVMKNMKTVEEWTKTGTSMYNQIVDVYNSTEKGRRKPLRKVNRS